MANEQGYANLDNLTLISNVYCMVDILGLYFMLDVLHMKFYRVYRYVKIV